MQERQRQEEFSVHIDRDIERVRAYLGYSSDVRTRIITAGSNQQAAIYYLDGMVDNQTLQESVIGAIQDCRLPYATLETLEKEVINAGQTKQTSSFREGMEEILSGSVLITLEGVARGLLVSLPGWEERSITESKVQPVIRGPQDSFTETLSTNTTLIRRRVKDPNVRVGTIRMGRSSKTDVAIMYIQGVADDKLVRTIASRLTNSDIDRVLEGQYIEEVLLERNKQSLFPLIYNTDRPDAIAAGIQEGRVAIIIDGTPFVLLAPAVFADFIQSSEDYYQSYLFSSFIRLLRYMALMICMLTPSVYIAVTTYHQDMLPTQLLLSLASQREGVPFPAFLEAVLMEVIFEILREAGLRMPRTIGQAVSIVGTIVIGQAAVEASIVSAAMVIIVSITAISSFVLPSYAMSIPIRMIRFGFMALAATFGVYGLTIGFIVTVIHLCSLNSFGKPYMTPFAPYKRKSMRDAILRFPFRDSNMSGHKGGS